MYILYHKWLKIVEFIDMRITRDEGEEKKRS
jgi:hypothetical protein